MTDLPIARHGTRAGGGRSAAEADPLLERFRRPIHVGTLLGLSTGLYATTLAGVAILQQQADHELAAARAPAVAQVAELQAMNRRLADAANRLADQERALSADYDGLRSGIDAAEAALTDLAGVVGDVKGAAAALPERIALPAVPHGAAVRVASAPAHATAGGS
jgi:hypothetical protein